ncbi:response regulator [Ferrovum sp.]|uniref:response regulator n=1 Tax=Ferrovum sp. TaxID=2609467 RepID=UPI002617FE5E|nr:response regulator [Ferrovum sp.]
MTTGEAARMLGVGLNTVKRWINSGDLRGVCTPGGHWRISKDDLYAFMRARGLSIPGRDRTTPARMLIVDDDPSECTLLRAVLEQADFPSEIQCVHDGYTGLMRIGAWRPDVLVLDILMPGIDGLEVLSRIRADPDLDDMVIIVVTAIFDRFEVVQAARSAGVAALLPKPVEARRLLDIVGACLAAPPVASHDQQWVHGIKGDGGHV